MDKPGRIAIDAALDAAGVLGDGGEVFRDLVGPAVYRLEPTPMTAAVCVECRYVGLIPTIPKVASLVWRCGSCGKRFRLEPPARVWIEGSRPPLVPGRLLD